MWIEYCTNEVYLPFFKLMRIILKKKPKLFLIFLFEQYLLIWRITSYLLVGHTTWRQRGIFLGYIYICILYYKSGISATYFVNFFTLGSKLPFPYLTKRLSYPGLLWVSPSVSLEGSPLVHQCSSSNSSACLPPTPPFPTKPPYLLPCTLPARLGVSSFTTGIFLFMILFLVVPAPTSSAFSSGSPGLWL